MHAAAAARRLPPLAAAAAPSSPLLPAAASSSAQIEDKKLKGRLRYTEGLVAEAQQAAAKVEEWLLPSEAGTLEADGPLERTWRFKQDEIVQVRPCWFWFCCCQCMQG